MNLHRTAILLSLTMLPACASITSGSTQSIAVDTSPQKVSQCELSNEKGNWHLPETPGSATVNKAYGPLTVSCASKKGGFSGITTVESTTAGSAFGNIVAGGIIGAAVDMGSGAAYKYPAQVVVPLSKK